MTAALAWLGRLPAWVWLAVTLVAAVAYAVVVRRSLTEARAALEAARKQADRIRAEAAAVAAARAKEAAAKADAAAVEAEARADAAAKRAGVVAVVEEDVRRLDEAEDVSDEWNRRQR